MRERRESVCICDIERVFMYVRETVKHGDLKKCSFKYIKSVT